MKYTQTTIKQIGEALGTLSNNCYHYWRPQMQEPFIVWQEEAATAFWANNKVQERAVSGTVHYFTQKEYDPMADKIEATFDLLGVGWELESVQYEEETGLIHHEWSWECK